MESRLADAPVPDAKRIRKGTESRFFSAYMIAIALIIFVGFAPTFFLRNIVPAATPLEPLRYMAIVHGLLATAVVVLFPLQSALIASGQRQLHVGLGNWGFFLAAVLAPTIYVAGAFAYHALPADGPLPPMAVAGLSLLPLPIYCLALALAWQKRFDAQSHKRLMVLLACFLSSAALVRIPIWPPAPLGLLISQGVWVGLALPMWIWDLWAFRRVHPMTLIFTGCLIIQSLINALVPMTAWWPVIVQSLPGYGVPSLS